jgi:hypothetical protein
LAKGLLQRPYKPLKLPYMVTSEEQMFKAAQLYQNHTSADLTAKATPSVSRETP